MLRKRLITVLTFSDGILVRTKEFTPDYRYTLNFVDSWSVDEIIILDVTRPGEGSRQNFFDVVKHFAANCFVPLSVGGGIRTIDDVQVLLKYGADKVIVNSGAVDRPELIPEIAAVYGSQCVVLSIDAKKDKDGTYGVMSHFGAQTTDMTPQYWAKKGQELGAGEIMVTSIEQDGSLNGYDIELSRQIVDAVSVPVLICGGAGSWKHFVEGFNEAGASAVCTTNIYHFTETSIKSAKSFLTKKDINVRL